MKRRWIVLAVLALSVMGAPSIAADGNADQGLLNKLLAPGPLIEGHKELEHSRCLECHVPRKGIPDTQCLVCHDAIQRQVEKKKGFHGMASKTCIACHSDHKGRDFDSTKIDPSTFDHKLTGLVLEGKHAELKCSECHTQTRAKAMKSTHIPRPNDPSYIGQKTSCVSCHKKDDVHFYTNEFAKKDCNACHGVLSWKKDVKFSHEKDAHYKLEGKHAELACATCHVPKKDAHSIYNWPDLKKNNCLACHQDQHAGKMGAKLSGGNSCTQCHTQQSWKIEKFDHKVTGFTLKGKHQELQCIECHKAAAKSSAPVAVKDLNFKGAQKACASCHADFHRYGSYHSAKLGGLLECSKCHDESAWKPASGFSHNKDTSFPIGGKHLGVSCEKCHVPGPAAPGVKNPPRIYHWTNLAQKTCELCHKSPHTHSFPPALLKKRCTECHTDKGWKIAPGGGKQFDHSTTRFNLTGKHESLACEQCHRVNGKEVYKFNSADKHFCNDCHQNVHINQFHTQFSNKACSECHGTQSFSSRLPFDHSSTHFTLTGKHTSPLQCEKCHVPTKEPFPPLAGPTPGQGQMQPHFKSKFIFASGQKQFCIDCHENPHLKQFHGNLSSQSCATCHSTHDFTHRLSFDHSKTAFILRGKHTQVACQKCHVSTSEKFNLKPFGHKSKFLFPEVRAKDCAACHKDPHEGKYGKSCSACHIETGWKDGSANFHKNFELSGVHYTLQCAECHRDNRKLEGLSQMCLACHRKDDVHQGTLPDCGNCHRQQFWENPFFNHSMTNFPLLGAHRTATCNECHRNNIYKGLTSTCIACHMNDVSPYIGHAVGSIPDHSSLISQNCSNCHNMFSFH